MGVEAYNGAPARCINRPPLGPFTGPYPTLDHKNQHTGDQSSSTASSAVSYHDIVALHLRLLVGQFVILHFKTARKGGGFNELPSDKNKHFCLLLQQPAQLPALILLASGQGAISSAACVNYL